MTEVGTQIIKKNVPTISVSPGVPLCHQQVVLGQAVLPVKHPIEQTAAAWAPAHVLSGTWYPTALLANRLNRSASDKLSGKE